MTSLLRHIVKFTDSIQISLKVGIKYANSKVSDKITEVGEQYMIFNNSSDVMMTSLLINKGTESIRHLGSANLSHVFHFT